MEGVINLKVLKLLFVDETLQALTEILGGVFCCLMIKLTKSLISVANVKHHFQSSISLKVCIMYIVFSQN